MRCYVAPRIAHRLFGDREARCLGVRDPDSFSRVFIDVVSNLFNRSDVFAEYVDHPEFHFDEDAIYRAILRLRDIARRIATISRFLR